MNLATSLSAVSTRIALIAAIVAPAMNERAAAFSVSPPVRVSQAGEIVAEFSSATAPANPQLKVASSTAPQLEISIEHLDGTLAPPWQLPLPDSETCRNGRLVQPALIAGAGAGSSPAKRFQEGGDYWSFTWKRKGWLSIWVDPRSGDGPGSLRAAPVTATK